MNMVGAIVIVLFVLVLIAGGFDRRSDKAQMASEEARIARRQRGGRTGPADPEAHPDPFGHRGVAAVLGAYVWRKPMLGPQVSAVELLGDAAFATPGETADRSIYRTTWKARIIAPLVAAAMFAAILHFGLPGEKTPETYRIAIFCVAPFFAYGIALIWAFKAEIDGDALRLSSAAFFSRSYRLSEIVRIHEDGPMYWRVVFADGSRPQVLKMVVGADELRHRLAQALKANERG